RPRRARGAARAHLPSASHRPRRRNRAGPEPGAGFRAAARRHHRIRISPRAHGVPPGAAHGARMKPVWIVDDDQAVRWVLEKALARAGIATRTFSQAPEVLRALASETPVALVS